MGFKRPIICISIPNFIEISGFVWGHIWTTYMGYMVVFIAMQKLVAVDAAVSII